MKAAGQHEDGPAVYSRLDAIGHVQFALTRAVALHDTLRRRRAHRGTVGADGREEFAPAAPPQHLLEEMVPKLVTIAATASRAKLVNVAGAVKHRLPDERKGAAARHAVRVCSEHR